jgi:hypothetical protein
MNFAILPNVLTGLQSIDVEHEDANLVVSEDGVRLIARSMVVIQIKSLPVTLGLAGNHVHKFS